MYSMLVVDLLIEIFILENYISSWLVISSTIKNFNITLVFKWKQINKELKFYNYDYSINLINVTFKFM